MWTIRRCSRRDSSGRVGDTLCVMSRGRVILVVVLALVLAATVASWIRSRVSFDTAVVRRGVLRAPGEDVDQPLMWTYTSRMLSMNHRRGKVGIVFIYSKGEGAAREDMEGWLSQKSWETSSLPVGNVVVMPGREWVKYESLLNWHVLGCGMMRVVRPGSVSMACDIPHALPATVLTAAIGVLVGRPWLRRRRGRCVWCGYDLKHDYKSGCSECGRGRTSKA